MKKKLRVIIPCAILAFVLYVSVSMALYYFVPRTGAFTVDDYQEEIAYFYEYSDYPETYFGAVNNKWTAAKIGADFFKEVYGEFERPITVRYDSENDLWLVTDYFWPGVFRNKKGGSAAIIINAADGRLVTMWHGK